MRTHTVICLANSRKHGARCIAGIDPDSGHWIRPVSDLDDGRIEKKIRLVEGEEPRLLDVLYIPLADNGPDFGFESENRTVMPGAWSVGGRFAPGDLSPFCCRLPHVLHNDDNYVTAQYLRALPPHERKTLALIEATDFEVFSTGLSTTGGQKWHARFSSTHSRPVTGIVTDPVLVARLENGRRPGSHCLVTVSLSMPWKPTDWDDEDDPCWKLVAGVIELDTAVPGAGRRAGKASGEAAEDNTVFVRDYGDDEILETLERVFGFRSFRANQFDVVRAILSKHDAFVVMPTGGGKSLCYQLPAALMPGTCVVVSPLIALMKDQVDAAVGNGLRAAFLNSSQTDGQRVEVLRALYQGKLDLLYVAPERLALEVFFRNLKRAPLSFVAIDEAHCVSEWGHDFRPDYLFLAELAKQFPELPIAAFTATATQRVQEDIITRLGLRAPHLLRASFNRPNLFYQVTPKEDPDRQILEFVRRRRGEAGIVYRTTRKSVDHTAALLAGGGISALPYHAGLGKETRSANQEAFNRDEIDIIVATIAFGMGIDKPNVRFVLHGDLPKNIESYYQETGRGGRDGDPAHCLLLFGRGDIPKIRYFIDQLTDDRERQRLQNSLNDMVKYATLNVCRRKHLLNYFGEAYPIPGEAPPDASLAGCGACDVCTDNVERVDATRDAQIVLSAIARTGHRFGITHIVDLVTGADTERIRARGHHLVKTYGAGADRKKRHWRRIIDDLIAQECVVLTDGRYPVLQWGINARDVIDGARKIHVLRQKETPRRKRAAAADKETYDHGLFEDLRALRRRLADERNVPPYVIFPDRTLREIAAVFPRDDTELLAVTGVGHSKLEKYGGAFLDAVHSYLEQHPDACGTPSPAQSSFLPRDATLPHPAPLPEDNVPW
jgi:ATP-dependent DNA helicase RecQ